MSNRSLNQWSKSFLLLFKFTSKFGSLRLLLSMSQIMQWFKNLMHMLLYYVFQICILNRDLKCLYSLTWITNTGDFRHHGRLKRQSSNLITSSFYIKSRPWFVQRHFRPMTLTGVLLYVFLESDEKHSEWCWNKPCSQW